MRLKIFSVYDEKAMAYIPPFTLPTREMAVRVFGDMVSSDTHQFSMHPSDYTLFELGEFDDSDGVISVGRGPTKVVNGVEIVLSAPVEPELGSQLEVLKAVNDA